MPKSFSAKKLSLKVAALTFVSLCAGSANSTSNPPLYTLSWAAKGEQLTYRSCGCADSCWVAELRTRNSKRLRATLSCDCETLHVTYPVPSAERKLAESCSVINDAPDKFLEISKTMKHIVEGNRKK